MTRQWRDVLAILVGLLLLAVVIVLFATQQTTLAARDICRATLIIDRSGTIGPDDLTNLAEHAEELFAFGDDYELAFWTFAAAIGPKANGNYNAPYHRSEQPYFVPAVTGSMDSFMQRMTEIDPEEETNYEQGLGYNNGVQNPDPTIRAIADQTDVFLFLTDGVPNNPGVGDDNDQAKQAAWNAASRYLADGKMIVAALIGPNLSRESLAYMLTGRNMTEAQIDNDPVLSEDIIRIANYNDGAQFRAAMEKVREKCDVYNPPEPGATYNLIPAVSSDKQAVAPGSIVDFYYNVNNLSNEFSSRQTDWSVKQVVVEPGQSINPITKDFYTDVSGEKRWYRDGFNCSMIESRLNSKAECSDVTSGRRAFSINTNDMTVDVGDKSRVVIDESWEIGTKLCFILTLAQPTHEASPTQRYSRSWCVTIGKAPSVQVHGGDIRVGRKFFGDPSTAVPDGNEPKILTNTLTKADGQSFGSWAEYAAFAPDRISSDFSTGSGLADPTFLKNDWHRLTFANVGSEKGFYTGVNSVQNTMPNIAGALLQSRDVYRQLAADTEVSFNGNDVQSGLYQKEIGGIVLKEGTLPQGRTVVLNVPNGTVTIDGNLNYEDGPYTNINQIPQLVIIAKAIVVKADVTNIDAWLIANGEADGLIRTCDASGTLTDSICDRPLRINGPIMARTLELRRTAGAERGSEGDPAEVANLRADAFLWLQNEGRNGVRARTTHNVEVPPYF